MDDSYVCSGATLHCSFGLKDARLTVLPSRSIYLCGKPMANISDFKSITNIAPLGKCRSLAFPATAAATSAAHGKLTPMPCIPGTVTEWINGKSDYFVKGRPALLKSSFCRCIYGGIITIVSDGQLDSGITDMGRSMLTAVGEEFNHCNVEKSSVLDGIRLALDAAGFVPESTSGADITNAVISCLQGDFKGAGLSLLAAVPLIGDAAKATTLAKKGLKSAEAVARVVKLSELSDRNTRRANLVREASKFVDTEVSYTQLTESGMTKQDAEFFLKKVRYYRREAIYDAYSQSPNINSFSIESHLNAVDLSSSVEIGVMPKGTKMGMYINEYIKEGISSMPGNYAFDISLGKALPTTEELGVSRVGVRRIEYDYKGDIKQGSPTGNCYYIKKYHEVELTQDMTYVKSRSRKILDSWSDKLHPQKMSGGGEQVFLQDKSALRIIR